MDSSLQTFAPTVEPLAVLRARLERAGCLERRWQAYLPYIVGGWGAVAFSAFALAQPSAVIQFIGATLYGLGLVQLGGLAHDAGHHQIASARQLNQWLAFIHWDFGTGLSAAWWRDKHHRHHANTNRPTVDADLYSFLTYSDEEAQNATGLKRLIARHQVAWFISLSPFTRWFFLLLSLNFVARRPRLWLGHAVAISAHFVLAFALFSAVDDLWRGIALYTLASIITGVYMVYVFAPNHTGMPLNCDGPIDYRDQLRATRNIRTGPIGDVVWVGLNYQIEHHLFPQLPRGQLHRASHIVATWCAEQNLPYHRQSSTDGWRDVFSSFHSVRDAAARQVGRA